MSKRARMDELADKLGVLETEPTLQPVSAAEPKRSQTASVRKTRTAKPETALKRMNLNPPHGEKDSFEKITVTLPGAIRLLLLDESHRRKVQKQPDWSISVIVREALVAHLQK